MVSGFYPCYTHTFHWNMCSSFYPSHRISCRTAQLRSSVLS